MSSLIKPKLFYMPNEWNIGDQVGPRHTFEQMLKNGELAGYEAFSFLHERRSKSGAVVVKELVDRVVAFQPDLLLCQHLGKFSIPGSAVKEMRSKVPNLVIGYHEADVYGRFVKPLPKATLEFAGAADVAFLVGMGSFAERFRAAGAPKVLYAPHSADTVRFGTPWTPTLTRQYDVVMIANRVTSRIPFRTMPGQRDRLQLVEALTSLLGEGFALYGTGWDGFQASKGPIPFNQQETVIRDSWMSIGLDSFLDIPLYFSNRLPIAMISGVAFLSSRQPGMEGMFQDGRHLVFFDSVDDAVQKVAELLGGPRERLLEIGQYGRDLVVRHHTDDVRMRYMISEMIACRPGTGLLP